MNNINKLALVTGASRGIGQSITLALARQGFTVIGTATTSGGADHISTYLQAQNLEGRGYVLDVTDAQAIEQLSNEIQKQYGSPTVLVNNAAVTGDNLMLRMKQEQWDSIIDTNLNSIYRMTK